jgi:hypothetical protein
VADPLLASLDGFERIGHSYKADPPSVRQFKLTIAARDKSKMSLLSIGSLTTDTVLK